MVKRSVVFLSWCCIGAALSYAALYVFTPYGLALIAASVAAGALIPAIGGRRWPETLGLLGGPGAFCLVVANDAGDPRPWSVAGGAFLAMALLAYLALVHARSARDA